jgi:hypothetical protein
MYFYSLQIKGDSQKKINTPFRQLSGGNKENHWKLSEASRGRIEIRIQNIPNTILDHRH